MTWNVRVAWTPAIRHAWWRRREATREELDDPADLIGLQEVQGPHRRLFGQLADRTAAVAGRRRGHRGEAAALLWRPARFAAEAQRTFWYSDRPTVPGSRGWGNRAPRMALLVDLVDLGDRAGGRRISVAVTHFDDRSGPSRVRSAHALAGWTQEPPARPWIVLGDLNDTIDSPTLAPLLSAGFVDALAHVPSSGSGAATSHGFSGSEDGRRIDHVFVRGFDVLEGAIDHRRPRGRLASDHWPVIARLRYRS